MSLYDREWHLRRPVMEAALNLLSDFQTRTARQITAALPNSRLDYATPKLVASVLNGEGRRYIREKRGTYSIREYDIDPEFTLFEREWLNRKAVMENALGVLRDGRPRTAKRIVLDRARQGKNKYPGKRMKSEVNSVLFSEGRRFVKYDMVSNEHQIIP